MHTRRYSHRTHRFVHIIQGKVVTSVLRNLVLCPAHLPVSLAAVPEGSSKQGQQQQQQEPEGRLEQLRLSERDFRGVISLLRGSQELPEEPLEELDAREMGGR
jgi:hypothetical protein